MVSVGDRIRLTLNKGVAREGAVTGITGSMLRVRWTSGEESTVIPGPGTLMVLGRATRKASRGMKAAAAKRASGTKKTASPKKSSRGRRSG